MWCGAWRVVSRDSGGGPHPFVGKVNGSDPAGKALLKMLGQFAENNWALCNSETKNLSVNSVEFDSLE